MPFTPPTDDDLAALDATIHDLSAIRNEAENAEARLAIVKDRLSVVVPPPPPPAPALPAVGVGGSGAFGGLTPENQTKVLNLMRAAGITHFRFDVQWASVERSKGVYSLDGLKKKCQRVVAAGMIPQVLVGWAPPFYRINSKDPNSAPRWTDQLVRNAWDAFLRALMAALLPLGVRRYEIWNEPNGLFMQPVSPETWADMVIAAHVVSSDISRHIVIVAGGVCPRPNTPPTSQNASTFYDDVLAFEPDFFEFVDEVGIHPYAGDHTKLHDGKFWIEHVAHLRDIKPAGVPFCGTEHGWKSGKNTEPERAVLYTDTVTTWTEDAPVFVFSAFDFAEPYGLLTSQADGFKPKLVYGALRDLLA